MKNQTFKKKERLRLKGNFSNVFEKGGRLLNNYLVIIYFQNGLQYNRIGIIVPKKFGNAVVRNKFKRYMREIYRKNKESFQNGFDYIFIPRKFLSKEFKRISYRKFESILLEMVRNLKNEEISFKNDKFL
ncbi:ribonuclease P [Petrotoga sp. 9PW.55.5.1]|jgi:ribonuclease P protein component|uniref:ribonuclease P protein component n=1 Tax=Petrotoga sp. 9PW.55.5.1 TaxID=1308979 RepID=UPI000DC2C54E|nr:ribonuclease P protein component [Petrotoga sp. 9PW.55.5.1]RAO99071.1 ribonuclease P [Petrotoga sp. 9PW.55.5.1]